MPDSNHDNQPQPTCVVTTPAVSVIVPIFNTAAYLDQALLSIEAQTLQDIEIICVNDGSTDNSLAILEQHAALDDRIRIVNKPNGGYGSACNRGLDEARGTWIAIVEPDDWIDGDMYRAMVEYADSFDESSIIDIVKTPYWRVWMPDTKQQRMLNCSYKGRIRPSSQPFTIIDPGALHLLHHHPSIWSALYRRSFIVEKSIRFHEIPGAGWADNPFLIDTLCQARGIIYLDHAYYRYREETPEKSAAFARNNTFIPVERWHDMADCLERIGCADKGVWRIQNERAFTYLGGIVDEVPFERDDVKKAAASMFARMDDELVFDDPEISPWWKSTYAELKGLPDPAPSSLPYLGNLGRAFFYNLVNIGPAMTAQLVKSYLG